MYVGTSLVCLKFHKTQRETNLSVFVLGQKKVIPMILGFLIGGMQSCIRGMRSVCSHLLSVVQQLYMSFFFSSALIFGQVVISKYHYHQWSFRRLLQLCGHWWTLNETWQTFEHCGTFSCSARREKGRIYVAASQ